MSKKITRDIFGVGGISNLVYIEKHLRSRNGALIGLIFLVFIFITVNIFNNYYQLKTHNCLYSSVDKCVASDKFCASQTAVSSNSYFGLEFLTNEELTIKDDFSNVNNQSIDVGYYNLDENKKISDAVFKLDFDFDSSVPAGGTSNINDLGPSVGFFINEINENTASGISFYLYPFKNLSGTSTGQINDVINNGFDKASSGYNNVAYIDNPLGDGNNNINNKNAGVIFIQGMYEGFQLGTFISSQYEVNNISNLDVTSSETGKAAIFNNFKNEQSIPYQGIRSFFKSSNITQNIKINNFHNNEVCNDEEKRGCACVEPGTHTIPNCRDYYYNQEKLIYVKNDNENITTRFCSYSAVGHVNSNNDSPSMALNQPQQYESTFQGTKPTYYFSGYRPGDGTQGDKNSPPGEAKERYNLPAIFCSDLNKLDTRTSTINNDLYEKDTDGNNASDLTKVYNSNQPNYLYNGGNTGGVVSLGHQEP